MTMINYRVIYYYYVLMGKEMRDAKTLLCLQVGSSMNKTRSMSNIGKYTLYRIADFGH
jgi:hypothetical protein